MHSAALSYFHINPTFSTCAASVANTPRLHVYSHAEHAELGVGGGGVEGGRERERDHAAGVARQNDHDSIVQQACAGGGTMLRSEGLRGSVCFYFGVFLLILVKNISLCLSV